MPELITGNEAQYALDIVKRICAEVGPGVPGSPQERRRAAIIQRELESHLGPENVAVEEFTLAPGAFLSAYPVSAVFMLAAALLNVSAGRISGVSPWLTATAALVFSVASPVLFICQFVLFRELVDPLLRKGQSVNVIGTLRRPGAANARRLLIISGHHDSAPQNTWLSLLGYGFLVLAGTQYIGFATMLVMSIMQLAGVIAGNAGLVRTGTLGWVLMAYPVVPAVVYAMFFSQRGKNGGTVPGAADNLSASALAVAMCRFLVKHPSYIPADTEIRFISFGSEEAGLRGSRRYVKRHLDELKRLDVRLLNIETVAHPEAGILTSDMNGSVKNSPEMVRGVVAAAARAGVPYRVLSAFLGVGNDSGPFSQAGLKALTLLCFKVPQQLIAFYHQKRDRPGILTTEPLLNVLKLTFEWIRNGGQ